MTAPDVAVTPAGQPLEAWAGRIAAAPRRSLEGLLAEQGWAERRLAEWSDALDALDATPQASPQLPDGGLGQHEDRLAGALESWPAARPTTEVVLAAPWRHDPHPDHAACGRVAAEVAGALGVPLIGYPVWMTYWTDPGARWVVDLELSRLDVPPEAEAVVGRPRAAFVTQLEPLAPGFGPVVPEAMLRHQNQQLVILTADRRGRSR